MCGGGLIELSSTATANLKVTFHPDRSVGATNTRCFTGNLLSQNKPIHDLKLPQRA